MINTNLFRSACSACSASPQLTALDRQKFDSWLRGKSKLMPVLPKKTKGEEPLTVYDFEINTATLVWVKFVRYVIRLLVVLVVYHSVLLCTHSVPTVYPLPKIEQRCSIFFLVLFGSACLWIFFWLDYN